jgi:diaminohydroxyphosphoribosylaminopyrimidine deaminase/5-amino-6-(5-phosphoribosylamino)uracil reductase
MQKFLHFAKRANMQRRNGLCDFEPCAHYGRTPPCAEALVKAQVKKVVVACSDPNPLVAGKGVQILKNAGIEVETEFVKKQLNLIWLFKSDVYGLPYVRLKIASSLDGRTAMASGESKWITGAAHVKMYNIGVPFQVL